jgi:hypothetical protein
MSKILDTFWTTTFFESTAFIILTKSSVKTYIVSESKTTAESIFGDIVLSHKGLEIYQKILFKIRLSDTNWNKILTFWVKVKETNACMSPITAKILNIFRKSN